jgi:prepilin-type N-terminal cleavage/methylation domain-containing protein
MATNRRGLTFVEMLVAVSLLALVSMTAVATFTGGIRVWERVQAHGDQDKWLHLAVHELRRDLRNLRIFTPVPFEGDGSEFSAAAIVPSPPPPPYAKPGEAPEEELGRVAYYFDAGRRRLCRSQHIYRGLEHARAHDTCQPVLERITRARFSYFGASPESGQVEWVGRWESPQPPMAVKVEFRYDEPTTRRPIERTVVVSLPLYRVDDGQASGGDGT